MVVEETAAVGLAMEGMATGLWVAAVTASAQKAAEAMVGTAMEAGMMVAMAGKAACSEVLSCQDPTAVAAMAAEGLGAKETEMEEEALVTVVLGVDKLEVVVLAVAAMAAAATAVGAQEVVVMVAGPLVVVASAAVE